MDFSAKYLTAFQGNCSKWCNNTNTNFVVL